MIVYKNIYADHISHIISIQTTIFSASWQTTKFI